MSLSSIGQETAKASLRDRVVRWSLVEALFADYRWYRRIHGGCWERWHTGGTGTDCWLVVPRAMSTPRRTATGERIAREDWERKAA